MRKLAAYLMTLPLAGVVGNERGNRIRLGSSFTRVFLTRKTGQQT